MIPYLLAALGGYLIGDSIGEDIDKKIPEFADGGLSDQLEKVRGQRDSVINPDELYRKLGEAERNWQKDGGEEYARVQRQIQENRKLYFKKLGESEMNWNSDDGAEYTRLINMRDKFEKGGMMAEGGMPSNKLLESHLKEAKRTKADIYNLGYSSGEDYIESKTSENKEGNNYLYSEITAGKVTHEWSSR